MGLKKRIREISPGTYSQNFNLGGNVIGNKITKGLIKNSSSLKAKDPISNAINSYLGNTSGGTEGLVGSEYKNLNTSTNKENQKIP
ncbi:MAG TPA: hypothetical protein VFI29_17585, partial [Hanamia sp.]|nr:hypothetical protein [Hanamia sp.]